MNRNDSLLRLRLDSSLRARQPDLATAGAAPHRRFPAGRAVVRGFFCPKRTEEVSAETRAQPRLNSQLRYAGFREEERPLFFASARGDPLNGSADPPTPKKRTFLSPGRTSKCRY